MRLSKLVLFLAYHAQWTDAIPAIDGVPTVHTLLEHTKRQFSLPPLIPHTLPAVDQLINDVAVPLPVLQIPTPSLPNPGYIPSNIRPKKIIFVWTGAGDNKHSDFLCSFSLDDDTFGTLLRVVEIGSSGNSPHHSAVSLDGKVFWGGGLLSLLKTQDTGYYFRLDDPYEPTYWKSDRALLASIADEVVAKPGGGFFITYMGSAVGLDGGRLIETDENYNIIRQLPDDAAGLASLVGQQFSPHGLSIDFEAGLILTSDFIVPASILHPVFELTGKISANTCRLWDLNTRTIINTITIPNGGGMQDVKFIPGNPERAAITTAVHLGQVWVIYPYRLDANGRPGYTRLLYDFGLPDTVAIYSIMSKDGRFAYFTFTTANRIAVLDISDLDNPIRVDNPYEVQPIVGPHYIKLTPDERQLVVCDYFVQTGPIGVINTPADYRIQYIDILPNGGLSFGRYIDFENIFPQYGGARPHSFVIMDFQVPFYPQFY